MVEFFLVQVILVFYKKIQRRRFMKFYAASKKGLCAFLALSVTTSAVPALAWANGDPAGLERTLEVSAEEAEESDEVEETEESEEVILMEANKTAHCPAFNHMMVMIKSGVIGEVQIGRICNSYGTCKLIVICRYRDIELHDAVRYLCLKLDCHLPFRLRHDEKI